MAAPPPGARRTEQAKMKHARNPHALKASLSLALALALLAGTAAAQSSSLTVFGTADASARYANTDRSGAIKSLASGRTNGSTVARLPSIE